MALREHWLQNHHALIGPCAADDLGPCEEKAAAVEPLRASSSSQNLPTRDSRETQKEIEFPSEKDSNDDPIGGAGADMPNDLENAKKHAAQPTNKIRLKKPRAHRSYFGFIAGAAAVLGLLGWILPGDPPSQPSPAQDADKVVAMASSHDAPEVGKTTPKLSALHGVNFKLTLPADWKAQIEDQQIFLRKLGDGRVCQITSDPTYDQGSLRADALGKEVDFEMQMKEEILRAVAPKTVHIETQGKLLSSTHTDREFRYSVFVVATMSDGIRKVKQATVSTVSTFDSRMARIDCVDISGTTQQDSEMTEMVNSFAVVGKDGK